MAKRKNDKKIFLLEPFFENIFVCNDKRLRPFIDVFICEPENIAQQNLGSVLGIFEIADTSEESSYIANYLISVIKKEYFSRPKRGAVESLEASLHKANLALSKLAEHGSISWIGKLNALIAVIEKNNLHLSQAGNCFAFMLRSKSLTDISEGLAPAEDEPNPLKTFVNISSGRLEDNDKILITTQDIFSIFSLEEIKKSALRFPGKKFIQFLKTALGNELEKAAVLVVDLKEKEESSPVVYAEIEKEEVPNAFSSNAFQKNTTPSKTTGEAEKESQESDPEEELKKEKNGHIYIKESEKILPERQPVKEFFAALANLISEAFRIGGKILKRLFRFISRMIKNISRPNPKPAAPAPLPVFDAGIPGELQPSVPKNASSRFFVSFKKIGAFLLPDLSRAKKIAARFDYQQRLYALLIIILIIAVPLFALKMQGHFQQKDAPPPPEEAPAVVPLAGDKNVSRPDALNEYYSGINILTAVNLDGNFFGITETEMIDLSSRETTPVPENFGKVRLAAGMDDLNLIFILSFEGKLAAWSPLTKKFSSNNLKIPDNSGITAIGSYLTYFYLLDARNSQIYRYPRAEEGFGEKTNWLKDPETDLSGASGMALSDNIYVADNQDLIQLFKGKKQDFNLESTATPISPFKVYTKKDSPSIFILDKQNARIVKLDTGGNIVSQYYHAEIANANDLTVDEGNNLVYFSTPNTIKSFQIN